MVGTGAGRSRRLVHGSATTLSFSDNFPNGESVRMTTSSGARSLKSAGIRDSPSHRLRRDCHPMSAHSKPGQTRRLAGDCSMRTTTHYLSRRFAHLAFVAPAKDRARPPGIAIIRTHAAWNPPNAKAVTSPDQGDPWPQSCRLVRLMRRCTARWMALRQQSVGSRDRRACLPGTQTVGICVWAWWNWRGKGNWRPRAQRR